MARKNTDGKLKKKQKNLKKNSTETNSNSKPEEKGNSREEKINEVESQVGMGLVWLKSLGKIGLKLTSALKGRLWHTRKNHKYSQNLFHRLIFRKSFTILFLSANFSETIFRSFNFDKPKRLFIDILDSFDQGSTGSTDLET